MKAGGRAGGESSVEAYGQGRTPKMPDQANFLCLEGRKGHLSGPEEIGTQKGASHFLLALNPPPASWMSDLMCALFAAPCSPEKSNRLAGPDRDACEVSRKTGSTQRTSGRRTCGRRPCLR